MNLKDEQRLAAAVTGIHWHAHKDGYVYNPPKGCGPPERSIEIWAPNEDAVQYKALIRFVVENRFKLAVSSNHELSVHYRIFDAIETDDIEALKELALDLV